MADNRPAEAIDVVARWALSDSLEREYFPDLSDRDFDAVCVQAALRVACPSVDAYEAAYEYLAARADGGEATP